MNIFEEAARKKYRFASIKGDLTVEQLFDLPVRIVVPTRALTADLISIKRNLKSQIKELGEDDDDFETTESTPVLKLLNTKLEIVKFIIDDKNKIEADRKTAAERDAKRRRLVEALVSKEDEAINNMTADEIRKELERIDEGK